MRLPALPLLLAVAACGRFPAPEGPAPSAYAPSDVASATAWARDTRPAGNTLIRFGWQYRDGGGSGAKGSGAVRLAGRDSLRLDFRGPLGQGRGAAVVVGGQAIWAVPADQVEKFAPSFQLLWGMLGMGLAPEVGERVLMVADDRVTAWRYVSGADTVDYLRVAGNKPQLLTDVRSGGQRIGRALATFDASGRLTSARLEVPSGPARLDLNVTAVSAPRSHPEGTWDAPVDAQ